MIRAFVALPLPPSIREELGVVQHLLPLDRRVPPENFHITLAFLGAQSEDVLERVHDGLSALSAPPLSLRISAIGTFGRAAPRLIFAAIDPDGALSSVQAKVARIAVSAGVELTHKKFVPHVTLSRDRPRGPDLPPLEHAIAELSGFTAGPFAVDEIVLFRSDRGKAGPIYTPLARYPLGR